jgi:hypothetical protein
LKHAPPVCPLSLLQRAPSPSFRSCRPLSRIQVDPWSSRCAAGSSGTAPLGRRALERPGASAQVSARRTIGRCSMCVVCVCVRMCAVPTTTSNLPSLPPSRPRRALVGQRPDEYRRSSRCRSVRVRGALCRHRRGHGAVPRPTHLTSPGTDTGGCSACAAAGYRLLLCCLCAFCRTCLSPFGYVDCPHRRDWVTAPHQLRPGRREPITALP